MLDQYKFLSFVILVKRQYKNSTLTSFRTRKKAEELGLSVNTLRRYVNNCLDNDWAYVNKKGQLKFRKLKVIIAGFHKKYKINIGFYDLLTREDVKNDFREIYDLLLYSIINENVRMRQEYNIRLKNLSAGQRLTKKQLKAVRKEILKNLPDLVTKPEEYKKLVKSGADAETLRALSKTKGNKSGVKCAVTSARHTSKVVKLSKNKANQMLRNENPFYKTYHRTFMIKGCNFDIVDALQDMFPTATVIPLPHYDRTRISFGREILHKDHYVANIFELDEKNPIKQLLKMHQERFLTVIDIVQLKRSLRGTKVPGTRVYFGVRCTKRKKSQKKEQTQSRNDYRPFYSDFIDQPKNSCSPLTVG